MPRRGADHVFYQHAGRREEENSWHRGEKEEGFIDDGEWSMNGSVLDKIPGHELLLVSIIYVIN